MKIQSEELVQRAEATSFNEFININWKFLLSSRPWFPQLLFQNFMHTLKQENYTGMIHFIISYFSFVKMILCKSLAIFVSIVQVIFVLGKKIELQHSWSLFLKKNGKE